MSAHIEWASTAHPHFKIEVVGTGTVIGGGSDSIGAGAGDEDTVSAEYAVVFETDEVYVLEGSREELRAALIGALVELGGSKVEALHVRHPDIECGVQIWVDGRKVEDHAYVDIDPGRGYSRTDWTEARELIDDVHGHTPFGKAALTEHDYAAGSDHIRDRE